MAAVGNPDLPAPVGSLMLEPIVPSDLLRIVVAADPQIAPDAACVIYRRTHFDVAGDRVSGALWRVPAGADPEPFTSGENDRMPRIDAACERLAFVRDVGGSARIHIMPLGGGEARAVGESIRGVSSLAWSPSGTHIAYTAHAPFDAGTAHIYLDEASGARHIRALPYKTDTDGLLDGRRSQLYVLDVATGSTRLLTAGDADAGNAVWSPDGKTIAFTRAGAAESSMLGEVASIEFEGGIARRVSVGDGSVGALAFSPDGTQIAWFGHRHGNDSRYHSELLVANVDGSGCRSLSSELDRPVADTVGGDLRSGGGAPPFWQSDSTILALVTDGGATSVRAFDLETGNVAIVAGGEREIYGFAASGDVLAIVYSTPLVPSAIALVTIAGEQLLVDCNAWLADKALVEPKRLPVTAADGTAIDAWLIAPRTQSTSAPLVLEIHGGPHATYGATFFLEFQVLASHGFGVAYGNPRGGAGYGQAFANAITGDWGGLDASDVLSILDAALATGSFDPARVAAVGGSYGGFMTTWLLGHSDRFATGISMRACNDFVSFTGATDIGFFLEAELGFDATSAGMRELFERSAIRAAERITAPLLVMHSERDFRCPIDQGEQLFNILRMLGKCEAEFVRFVGDGHELSRSGKPRHRVLRLRAIANWLLRQLGVTKRESGDDAAGSLFRPLNGEADLEAPKLT
jgi:dipeptidyl aminopeptidase/acylaminoacyl peptidase